MQRLNVKLSTKRMIKTNTGNQAKLIDSQSGYEPLNLENGSSVNSDNFDATDSRF